MAKNGLGNPFSVVQRLFLFQKQAKGQKLAPMAKTAMLEMIQRQYRIFAGKSVDLLPGLWDPIEARLTFKAINWWDLGK